MDAMQHISFERFSAIGNVIRRLQTWDDRYLTSLNYITHCMNVHVNISNAHAPETHATLFTFFFLAGLEVLISIRPGNAPLPENHGFQTITTFAEILT